MTNVADRYVLTGDNLDVPQIYPGNLKGCTAVLRDAQCFSTALGGSLRIDAVYGKERIPFRMYEAGECLWQMEQ